MEPAVLVASIIASYMSLAADRVVVAGDRWNPPEDQGIYVLVRYDREEVIGISRTYEPDSGYEEVAEALLTYLYVEVVSRGTDAETRHHEVGLALSSSIAIRAAEDAEVRIYRIGDALNISAVEGSAPLRRYRIPVAVANLRSKRVPIPQIVHFPPVEARDEA